MTDRPIIFSVPMVCALLDGRKTQTRRIIRNPAVRFTSSFGANGMLAHALCPVGKRGDRLWVREAHAFVWPGEDPVPQRECDIQFRADLPPGDTDGPGQWPRDEPDCPRWRPSIHMPRWASRLTLVVTDIRAQRLQDISEEDAVAEGAERLSMDDDGKFYRHPDGTFYTGFAGIWSHINGADSWDANPWVWALTFTVHRGNIDALPAHVPSTAGNETSRSLTP